MGKLVRSVVVKSHRFERGFFVDLTNPLDFFCVFAVFLTHHGVLAVELIDDAAALRLHFLSALLSIYLTLFRDGWLSLKLFLHCNLSWFSNTRIVCLRLKLQLVDVEAAESVGKLDLATLEELEVSFVVVDTIACEPVLFSINLSIDFTS